MKAILLAGGQGTRLRPLTLNTPKPVVPIFDRPFLTYQIDLLKQVPEIDEVVLSLNYQPEAIAAVFGDGSALGIKIRYVVEPEPLGTGGGIKFASRGHRRPDRRVQRRRAHLNRSRRRHPAASRAAGARHNRADAGGEPERLRPGGDRRPAEHPALPRKAASRSEITTNRINAGIYVLEPRHVRPHSGRRLVVDRAQVLPVADRARRDVPGLRLPGLLDRHRDAARSTSRCTTTSWPGASRAAPFRDQPAPRACVSPARADRRRARRSRARASWTTTSSSRPARASRPCRWSAAAPASRPKRRRGRRHHLARAASSGRAPPCSGSIAGRDCRLGANTVVEGGAVLGDGTILTDFTRV